MHRGHGSGGAGVERDEAGRGGDPGSHGQGVAEEVGAEEGDQGPQVLWVGEG